MLTSLYHQYSLPGHYGIRHLICVPVLGAESDEGYQRWVPDLAVRFFHHAICVTFAQGSPGETSISIYFSALCWYLSPHRWYAHPAIESGRYPHYHRGH